MASEEKSEKSYEGKADPDIVLAIDPGRSKCGLAVVHRSLRVLHRAIEPTTSLLETVCKLVAAYRPARLIVGTGTGCKSFLQALSTANPGVPVLSVCEKYTSEAARKRYIAEVPARGWQRLLPCSLRTPCEPYDDYVALILAERFWKT